MTLALALACVNCPVFLLFVSAVLFLRYDIKCLSSRVENTSNSEKSHVGYSFVFALCIVRESLVVFIQDSDLQRVGLYRKFS